MSARTAHLIDWEAKRGGDHLHSCLFNDTSLAIPRLRKFIGVVSRRREHGRAESVLTCKLAQGTTRTISRTCVMPNGTSPMISGSAQVLMMYAQLSLENTEVS